LKFGGSCDQIPTLGDQFGSAPTVGAALPHPA
jgi:hypothetical protein